MSNTPPLHAESLLAHASSLRALARALTWDEASAEDLVQETWLTALEKQPQERAGLGAWLRTVMRRRAQHRQRSEVARRSRERSVASPESVAPINERKAVVNALTRELQQLDEPYQTTLFLRYFEGCSVGEIAQAQGTTTGTVGARLHRGLATLRERLDVGAEGGRQHWLGALAPFLDPKLQGLIMSGNAKLGLATAALCVALALVWSQQPEEQQQRAVSVPPKVSVASPVQREAIPEFEREPQVPKDEVVAVEPNRQAMQPVEEPQVAAPQVSQAPEQRNVRFKREFTLSLNFDRKQSSMSVEYSPDFHMDLALDWTHDQEINVDDTIPSSHDFLRVMRGKWKTDFAVFMRQNGSEWNSVASLHASGRSPINKRKLRFAHDQETGWAVALLRAKRGQDATLTSDLRADMNLRAFAPPEHLVPGRQWAVEDDALRDLILPGGDMRVEFDARRKNFAENESNEQMGPEGLLAGLTVSLGKLDLTSTGPFIGRDFVGESFTAELDLSLTEEPQGEQEFESQSATTAIADRAYNRLKFTGKGDGVWSTEYEYLRALRLEGEVTLVSSWHPSKTNGPESTFLGTFVITVDNRRR